MAWIYHILLLCVLLPAALHAQPHTTETSQEALQTLIAYRTELQRQETVLAIATHATTRADLQFLQSYLQLTREILYRTDWLIANEWLHSNDESRQFIAITLARHIDATGITSEHEEPVLDLLQNGVASLADSLKIVTDHLRDHAIQSRQGLLAQMRKDIAEEADIHTAAAEIENRWQNTITQLSDCESQLHSLISAALALTAQLTNGDTASQVTAIDQVMHHVEQMSAAIEQLVQLAPKLPETYPIFNELPTILRSYKVLLGKYPQPDVTDLDAAARRDLIRQMVLGNANALDAFRNSVKRLAIIKHTLKESSVPLAEPMLSKAFAPFMTALESAIAAMHLLDTSMQAMQRDQMINASTVENLHAASEQLLQAQQAYHAQLVKNGRDGKVAEIIAPEFITQLQEKVRWLETAITQLESFDIAFVPTLPALQQQQAEAAQSFAPQFTQLTKLSSNEMLARMSLNPNNSYQVTAYTQRRLQLVSAVNTTMASATHNHKMAGAVKLAGINGLLSEILNVDAPLPLPISPLLDRQQLYTSLGEVVGIALQSLQWAIRSGDMKEIQDTPKFILYPVVAASGNILRLEPNVQAHQIFYQAAGIPITPAAMQAFWQLYLLVLQSTAPSEVAPVTAQLQSHGFLPTSMQAGHVTVQTLQLAGICTRTSFMNGGVTFTSYSYDEAKAALTKSMSPLLNLVLLRNSLPSSTTWAMALQPLQVLAR